MQREVAADTARTATDCTGNLHATCAPDSICKANNNQASAFFLLLLQLYLTFHSYGQYILYPWGYARRDTVDRQDLHNLGLAGARAAKGLSRRKYSVGTAAKMLYPAAGKNHDPDLEFCFFQHDSTRY